MSRCKHENVRVRSWTTGWVEYVNGREVGEVDDVEDGDYTVSCEGCGQEYQSMKRRNGFAKGTPEWVLSAVEVVR